MMTNTDMAQLLNDRIAPIIVGKLVGEMEILQYGSVFPNPNPVAGAGGNFYRVPIMGAGAANVRTFGGSTTATNVNTGWVNIQVKEVYERRDFDRTTLAALTPEQIMFHAEECLRDVVEKVNVDAYSTITSTAGIGSFGAIGTAVNRATLLQAKTFFHNNKIPKQDRFLIISEETRQDLFADADLKPAFQFNQAIVSGELPRIEGFNTFTSVYAESVAGPPAGHNNLAFHRNAIVNIFPDPTDGIDNTRQSMIIGTATLNGVTVAVGWELIPGTNGGASLSVWLLHGVGVVRTEGVAVIAGN